MKREIYAAELVLCFYSLTNHAWNIGLPFLFKAQMRSSSRWSLITLWCLGMETVSNLKTRLEKCLSPVVCYGNFPAHVI